MGLGSFLKKAIKFGAAPLIRPVQKTFGSSRQLLRGNVRGALNTLRPPGMPQLGGQDKPRLLQGLNQQYPGGVSPGNIRAGQEQYNAAYRNWIAAGRPGGNFRKWAATQPLVNAGPRSAPLPGSAGPLPPQPPPPQPPPVVNAAGPSGPNGPPVQGAMPPPQPPPPQPPQAPPPPTQQLGGPQELPGAWRGGYRNRRPEY